MEKTKKTNIIVADNLLDKLDEIRFRIVTKEQAGNALVFAKKLKEFAKDVEKKVKDRAGEIMYDEDITVMEVGDFKIEDIPPVDIVEYNPKQVYDVLGEIAFEFMKVSSGKLNKFLKTKTAKGEISMEIIANVSKGINKKTKTGYIKISKKRSIKK